MKHRPRINIKPEDADGTYSNIVLVAHSKAEFVLDFARMMPGNSAANLKSRIIMSPHAVKAFAKQLTKQVETFEKNNGLLTESNEQNSIGFNAPNNEDRAE